MKPEGRYPPISGGPKPLTMTLQDPTTSFSTAAELIYAIGAGITAAAGTRLALQWVLDKWFKLFSFRLQNAYRAPYRYFLSLPPRIGIG